MLEKFSQQEKGEEDRENQFRMQQHEKIFPPGLSDVCLSSRKWDKVVNHLISRPLGSDNTEGRWKIDKQMKISEN